LSLQAHGLSAQHWIARQGMAKVTIDLLLLHGLLRRLLRARAGKNAPVT
jgi:hypothetical protein